MIRVHLRLLLTLLVVVIVACGKAKSPDVKTVESLTKYADLPGLKDSHLPALRDELARLESERAMAHQLMDDRSTIPTALGTTSGETMSRETAAALGKVFEPELQSSLHEQLDDLYPVGRFEFSRRALQTAIQLKDRYDAQRRRIHHIVANLDGGFGIQLTHGLAADTSFTDVVTLGNRLDAVVAAELLHRDDLAGAIEIYQEMTVAVESLAEEKHVIPRIAAVHRRGEALRVLEAIATHPVATRETHQRLGSLIDDQLSGWPSDRYAWIGDRAVGMHAYELVRDGYLLSLLTDEAQSTLRHEVGLERLGKQVAENLDQDAMFYLRAMRQVIASCERPFHQRERVFNSIDRELQSLRNSLAYPLVADLILWGDVREGQRLQALDRARCEAWSLALASSIGAPRSAYDVNPLTGGRYVIELRADQVIVDGIDPEHGAAPIRLPRKRS